MSYEPVIFTTQWARGFRISDLFSSSKTAIDDVKDIVMKDVKATSVKMLLTWPAYPSVSHTHTIPLTEPLTRGNLALLITRAYAIYFQKLARLACLRSQVEYRVGHNALSVNDLRVLNVSWSEEDSAFVPETEVTKDLRKV